MFIAGDRGADRGTGYIHYTTKCAAGVAGLLKGLHEFTLVSGSSCGLEISEDQTLQVLPLVGSIAVDAGGGSLELQSGRSALIKSNSHIRFSNLEEDEVTFLVAEFDFDCEAEIRDVALDANLDTLVLSHSEPNIQIGQFRARKDGEVTVTSGRSLFVFVIEGAFEVQGRLLERRDGLSLSGALRVDFEALSDYAIILMIES
jgi:hypothetical protein